MSDKPMSENLIASEEDIHSSAQERKFLFLQGPVCPFFRRLSFALEDWGHDVFRVNLCAGDWLFWMRSSALNYRGTQGNWRQYIRRVLADEKITDILVLGERRSYHVIAIEEARNLGISTVSVDFGYLRPDFITFEYDGLNGDSQFPREREEVEWLAESAPRLKLEKRYDDSFWAMAGFDIAYNLACLVFHPLFPCYRDHRDINPFRIYIGTGWQLLLSKRSNRKANELVQRLQQRKQRYFVAALQMEGDFSIKMYSPFDSVLESLNVMLDSFAKNAPDDAHLVVKVHPLDAGGTDWPSIIRSFEESRQISGRLHVIRGGSIDSLFKSCLGLVTVNSTLGLRAVMSGLPVKTLGQAVYSADGIVSKLSLDEFWHNPDAPDADYCTLFVDALAATTQVRGVFYAEPGLSAAVDESLYRLVNNKVNTPLPIGELVPVKAREEV